MFDSLTEKLHKIFRNIAGYGKLTEKNMSDALRDIRASLLAADVNYKVVKEFIENVRQKALGKEIYKKVSPSQMLVKVVYDELVNILGRDSTGLNLSAMPSIIMLVGLHGCGKTTTCAKLGKFLKDSGKKPFLVPLDIQRPAAIMQLQMLGKQSEIDVFDSTGFKNTRKICAKAMDIAKKEGYDVLVLDTAGRLHIEKDQISELEDLKRRFHPHETILTIDSTTGQDAVNIAQGFNQQVGVNGIILTKVDADSRGGAALSVKAVTGKPIKFIGTGEHFKDMEPFHPDRIASQILGMGDIVTFIEKIEKAAREEKKHEKEKKKSKKHELDLQDFLKSITQIKKIAPMGNLLKMMPMGGILGGSHAGADKELSRIEAIINSMTLRERRHPEVLDGSRRKRIASGSGTTAHEVNLLLSRFEKMKKSMRNMQKGMGMKGFNMPKGRFPFPPPRF